MEMRDVIALLQEKIRMKANEISRMERDVIIAKSMLHNDIRNVVTLIQNHYPDIYESMRLPESD